MSEEIIVPRDWRITEFAAVRPMDDYEDRSYEVFFQQDGLSLSSVNTSTVPGVRVTPESAMLCTSVCASVRVISETIATMPLHLNRAHEDGGKVRDVKNPLYRILHSVANGWQSSFEFRELLTSHCCLYGNAYAEIVRIRGQVRELVPLHPSRVSVERLENGRLRYTYRSPDGQRVTYPQENILHLRWLSGDGITGLMPVGLARDAIQLARACEVHGIGFFANSARPSVVLETEHSIPPEAQERLREAWERVHRGPSQAGKTAILPNGLKAHELGQSNTDSQYLELRNFQLAEIARAYRVPAHLLGDLSRATFSNIESQSMDFLTHCILPWIRRWESALSMALFQEEPDLHPEFDTRGLMRADSATRASYYQTMMNLGIYSLNEVRETESLGPVEGGDTRFVTLNVQTLDAALAAAEAAKNPPEQQAPEDQKDGSQPEDALPEEDAPPQKKKKPAAAARSLESRNCGDGAGGFKTGNTCATGSTGRESLKANKKTRKRLVDTLCKPENAGGFSVDPVGFESPQSGLMVSLNHEQTTIDAKSVLSGEADAQVSKWLDEHIAELRSGDNKFIGGWLDEGSGKFFLDVSTRFEPDQESEVLEAAREAKQYAVFNLDTMKDTWVVYGKNDPRKPEDYDAKYADWLSANGLTPDSYHYGDSSVRAIDSYLDDICFRTRLSKSLRKTGVAQSEIKLLVDIAVRELESRGKYGTHSVQLSGDGDEAGNHGGTQEARGAATAEAQVGGNCGTGAGGFHLGNTCAAGGGDGDIISKTRSEYEAFPKNYSELSEEEQSKQHRASSARRKKWTSAVLAAISEGRMSVEDAKAKGLNPMSARLDKFEPLPDVMYHVTVAADKVAAEGLRSRNNRGSSGGEGLGGGDDDAVSLTTSTRVAQGIYDGMLEAKAVIEGKITPAQLFEAAKRGEGASRPWAADLQKHIEGSYGSMDRFLSGRMEENSVLNFKRRDEVPKDWEPIGEPLVDADNQNRWSRWSRPATDQEKRENAFNFYRANSLFRESAGGKYDPYFAFGDLDAFAAVKPENIKIFKASPASKQVIGEKIGGAEAEYRIFSGKVVKLEPWDGK